MVKKIKKNLIRSLALIGSACFTFAACAEKSVENVNNKEKNNSASATVANLNGGLKTNQEDFYDNSVIYKLPETVEQNDEISVIVELSQDSIMDAFKAQATAKTVSEYATSREAKKLSTQIERKQNNWLNRLNKSGIKYTLGERYDTILNGFEIVIKAKDFDKLGEFFEGEATLIVGEEYEAAQTEPVHNYVDVYETGIFDTSTSKYQGDGVVVAVLDTGLDYTHTAFSVDNFTTTNEAFTLDTVSEKVGETAAAEFTQGLTGQDVYVNKKVPYAYDYADKDPDVLPINSEHGTHVAGIIAGKDDEITGVAPNAQLAIMKVFSDAQQGAKDSWILAALEDCVTLGVDVINMSLGSNCGFAREVDEERTNEIYDSIREAGISLIAAAGNDYNATMGSEKNGSNPLTSNPDSGPVGAPSTYAASLSVASVDGVKTPYLRHGDDLFYFKEASAADAEPRHFVDEILAPLGVDSYEFEYVTIPGIGRSADYPEEKEFYKGKIVLVKRGQTTFEDKVRVAIVEKGAAGIIIYNNVSGDISMSIGESTGAVCSISQDVGEKLAAAGSGIIKVSKNQVAGPFMSDFSSWGPTSDLQIKPEITAHGGEIYSAVPGQSYDRLSGTSMAAPNQAGAAALIREFVKYENVFGTAEEMEADPVRVTKLVNQLMMSTTDIVLNKNGLPYSVRKQGSGLVNIANAYSTAAYISTFEEVEGEDGSVTLQEMDKTKLELGDDKDRTGVYEMTFAINNISANSVTYELGSIIQTEGVSEIYTSHSDTTVTQEGYLLEGTQMSILSVTGGTQDGMNVTVASKQSATVTVKLELSADDKAYMENSFKYGMYVEGFITLKGVTGTTVDMNVPMLAFCGDWTEAPIFDEEYYDTHKDEINAGLDAEDKLMPDAYATRVIGGLYSDYIATLGTYYFVQDPNATQIAADKDKIAISNQENGSNSSITSISAIWAGLLRNVKEWDLTIVEDATGKVVFTKTGYNQVKSSSSGSTIYQSNMEVDFSALEHNLKNNTKYTVTVETYIDYGTKEEQDNVRNTFEFPLYIDFEAPVVTDVVYRTEYDKTAKKTHLYADLSIYDNHYAMGMQIGQIIPETDPETEYIFTMQSFGKYVTPIYSSYNSTSKVTLELTDYVAQIKNSCGLENGKPTDGSSVVYNNNSFIATCYDYAMNVATYEISLPDEIISMYFTEEAISLSPNETKDLSDVLNIYPNESWLQILDFETSDSDIVDVVNQTVIAKKSGTATVTAIGYSADGSKVTADLTVNVLAEGDEGYQGGYTIPEINKFTISGYTTNKAYYGMSSEDREIGVTGGTYDFDGAYTLSMFPSESVTLLYTLDSYFPDRTSVSYAVGNQNVATVDETGTIVAQTEGTTIVTVTVNFDGNATFYSGRVAITVKDPYTTNAIYLMSYKGLGGEVVIPGDRGITTIYPYAFSNYEYVDKDLSAGDVIDDEDPYNMKQVYIGENTITKVVIPEGVTHINEYAFAGLTALEEVVLPSTLVNIGVGAFYGCVKLKTINLENVKFINASAFSGPLKAEYNANGELVKQYYEACALEEVNLSSINAIGNYAFRGAKLNYIELPESSQSLGIGAFANNEYLTSVTFKASKVKVGSYVFANCTQLLSIDINAAVISSYAFSGCSKLAQVSLGKDVAVIGEFAFSGTNVSKFTVAPGGELSTQQDGALLMKGGELLLVAPNYAGNVTTDATSIAVGAFAGNTKIYRIYANNVITVGAYAFANCTQLREVQIANATKIGDYAFFGTALTATPDLSLVESIGDYAFGGTKITSVKIADNTLVGNYAFYYNTELRTVEVGNGVTLGEGVFYCPVADFSYDPSSTNNRYGIQEPYYSHAKYVVYDENGDPVPGETYDYYYYNYTVGVVSVLEKATIGDNTVIGAFAFAGNAKMTTVEFGANVTVGEYAFFNNASLVNVDLSTVISIGEQAFSGSSTQAYWLKDNVWQYAFELEYVNGEIRTKDYMRSSFAPVFEEADLSSATYVGDGAFMNNVGLKTVLFGAELTNVADFAFAYCRAMETISFPEYIEKIGSYAFYGTSLKSVDLSNVTTVGEYAFARSNLSSVLLKAETSIENGAFAYCYDLATVQNMDKVSRIGNYAFAGVALTEATLTNATYVGDYAFGESTLTKVVFGDKLTSLGENPFYLTEIESYGKMTEVIFNGQTIATELEENYDVSATVKVIDGVLYQIVPNGGLELVSYPKAKADTSYRVEEGTVRISAKAFSGASLGSVTLASTLRSLGDKAFYGCENLGTVIFLSYEAPILEEEYDAYYVSYENLPYTGYMATYEGLGISPFYMWNATSNYSNFYYGANFVDHIGHIDNRLVMVRPANGQHYDTFIMSQYFGTTVQGNHAATAVTLEVMAMIAALPDAINVTLADKAAIEAARAAYNNLPNEAQKSLVDVTRLEEAEIILGSYIDDEPQPVPPVDDETEKAKTPAWAIVLIVAEGVLLLGCAGFAGFLVWKKNGCKCAKTEENTENSEE